MESCLYTHTCVCVRERADLNVHIHKSIRPTCTWATGSVEDLGRIVKGLLPRLRRMSDFRVDVVRPIFHDMTYG